MLSIKLTPSTVGKLNKLTHAPARCVDLGDVDALLDLAARAKGELNTVWTFHARIPLKAGAASNLKAPLTGGAPVASYPGVHYARIALFPRSDPPFTNETHLLLAVIFDQSRELAINFLVQNSAQLETVLEHCQGYATGVAEDPPALDAFLSSHEEACQLFYVKYRWPENMIEESLRLRARFLKLVRDWQLDPEAHRDARLVYAFHDFLVENRKTAPGVAPPPPPPVPAPHATNTLNMLHAIKPGTFNLGAAIGSAKLKKDLEKLVLKFGGGTSSLTNVEVFRLILAVGQFRVHCLGEDPLANLETLHFARVSIVDPGAEKMLFGSVYDGNFEQYVTDFGSRVADEIDALWGLCVGYPANGCRDLDAFIAWMNSGRVDAPVFHLGHPPATVRQIEQSTQLRKELLKFCAKPFKPAKLRERLESFLDKHQALLT
jgi:hypothetical protein